MRMITNDIIEFHDELTNNKVAVNTRFVAVFQPQSPDEFSWTEVVVVINSAEKTYLSSATMDEIMGVLSRGPVGKR